MPYSFLLVYLCFFVSNFLLQLNVIYSSVCVDNSCRHFLLQLLSTQTNLSIKINSSAALRHYLSQKLQQSGDVIFLSTTPPISTSEHILKPFFTSKTHLNHCFSLSTYLANTVFFISTCVSHTFHTFTTLSTHILTHSQAAFAPLSSPNSPQSFIHILLNKPVVGPPYPKLRLLSKSPIRGSRHTPSMIC